MAKETKKKQTARAKAPAKKKELTSEEIVSRIRKDRSIIPTAKIKVVGVGGGGGNAISRMYEYFPRSVDLIAINTDLQDLEEAAARKKIYIGRQITRGLGAGMRPEIGKQAAEESREEIANALAGADMIFLTAGFGGGTGSGAAPVVAEIAQEMGILTIAVVTKPFSFEGVQRTQIAEEALVRLKDRVDAYITISNDRIFTVIDKDTSFKKAFEAIDEVLKNAVLGITEIIMSPGIINVDFADIRTIMQGSGASIIGVGIGSGKDRALNAAREALNSPLLETSVDGAKGVLYSISGHRDIKMSEIHDVARMISENIDPGARIIFGTYHDRRLNKGSIKVTLIATGFGSSFGKNVSLFNDFDDSPLASPIKSSFENASRPLIFEPEPHTRPLSKQEKVVIPEPEVVIEEEVQVQLEAEPTEDDDMWDIPAFLRKKKKK